MNRRTFLWHGPMMAGAVGAVAQDSQYTKLGTGITIKGKAVVCDGEAVKCPLGHDTCREVDAPLAVGNDSYQNPEVAQLRSYKMLMCQNCGVLFAKKT